MILITQSSSGPERSGKLMKVGDYIQGTVRDTYCS